MRRAISVVAAGVVLSAGCSVQTLGAPKGDLRLAATFDDVQTLVTGHSVQISDVRIGSVTGIRLEGFRARVAMSIKNGRNIPVGTTATIARTSLLGENYVRLDLPPGRDLRTGPFLRGGAVITNTSVQPDLEMVSERVGPLLAALGGQNLSSIIGSSAQALAGQGPRLNRLIKQANAISSGYAAASADLARLIDGLARLGANLSRGSAELDRLPANISLATRRLDEDRHRLRRSVQELTRLAGTFNERVQTRHGARLKEVLDRLNAIVVAAARGRDDLKAIANQILRFVRTPSVTHEGQGLMYVWLKGLLPARTAETPAAGPGPDLSRLLGPR